MKAERPWGTWEVIFEDHLCKVKRIIVEPKHRLSYQSHEQRSELWMVVQGTAEVILNEETIILQENEFIHIPKQSKHRIGNPDAKTPLIFFEIQKGSYYGEDDITRYIDDYGR